MSKIREPKVAGMFYPSDSNELTEMIYSYLDSFEDEKNILDVRGIVAPHAGYVYSGRTASSAYKKIIDKNYENVIVISPSHREYFSGSSIYLGDAYKTPLGEIKINKEISQQMIDSSKTIFFGEEGHRAEHGLEVHLPFLQIVLGEFNLIPIVIGDQSNLFVNELSESMQKVVDDKTLIVASSDLSHFYTKQEANLFDAAVEKHINNFSFDELQKDLEQQKCFACGGGAIVSTMKALDAKNIKKSKVLMRSDSGDVSGDNSEVVGYLSAIIYN